MFTTNHIIWLCICIVIIVLSVVFSKKYKLSLNNALTIMIVISVISETMKICEAMILYNASGAEVTSSLETASAYLQRAKLPFHLCSIQIFFILIARFMKDEQRKNILLAFICPTAILGAVMSLIITIYTPCFNRYIVYQYFVYHAFLVAFGIYLINNKIIVLDFKAFIRNICFLFGMLVFSIYINGMFGHESGVNFMYTSKPPMNNLPILNMDNGWYVYILILIIFGTLLMFLLHLPFIIIDYKKKKLVK